MADNKQGSIKIDTGGGAVISGKVNTGGGDFVGRDQIKSVQQSQQGASIAELTRLIAEVQVLLRQSGLDPVEARAIESDLHLVETQAALPEPRGGLIKSRLRSAAELIQETGKTSDAIEKIIKLVGRASAVAAALFV